jgi:hypothetical protein
MVAAMRAASGGSMTRSLSRRPATTAVTPTSAAYSGGQVGLEVALDTRGSDGVELAVEVVRHLRPCVPAAQGDPVEGDAPLVARCEGAHQRHTAAAQALLGRRQLGVRDVADVTHREPLHVVEHDGDAVDVRQTDECVQDLLARLRDDDHRCGVHGVVVRAPVVLDLLDQELVRSPGLVDRDVVHDAPEPVAQRRLPTEGLGPFQCADHGVVEQVLRLVLVADQDPGGAQERGELLRDEDRELLRRRGGGHRVRMPEPTRLRWWSPDDASTGRAPGTAGRSR